MNIGKVGSILLAATVVEESKSNLTSLQVWVKKGDDWQMVARQATAVMASKP
jgi:hypothetical protein